MAYLTKCQIAGEKKKRFEEKKMAKLFAPYDPITEIF